MTDATLVVRGDLPGLPFADYECAHGRLPTDLSPACGCWPNEVPKPNTNPKEST